MSSNQRILPYGVACGAEGTPSVNVLNPDDELRKLPSKFGEQVKQGDLFRHLTAGAGGWGNPLERAPADVARDVWNGKLTAESEAKMSLNRPWPAWSNGRYRCKNEPKV